MAGDGCCVWTVLAGTWKLPWWPTLVRCLLSLSMGTDGLLLIRALIKLGNSWTQRATHCKTGLTVGWGHHIQMEGIKMPFLLSGTGTPVWRVTLAGSLAAMGLGCFRFWPTQRAAVLNSWAKNVFQIFCRPWRLSSLEQWVFIVSFCNLFYLCFHFVLGKLFKAKSSDSCGP